MPIRCLAITVLLVAACAPQGEAPPPLDPELVAVAEQVCPIMWAWQLEVGGIMNSMSASSKVEPDPDTRRMLYGEAFVSARRRNADLKASIDSLPAGPYVDRIREDVRNGLFAADRIITEVDDTVDSFHAAGMSGYHQVVSHIFMAFEKVIDVAKPEMADYANPELTRAFLSVAQCQHGVKDANDGRPRYVPVG